MWIINCLFSSHLTIFEHFCLVQLLQLKCSAKLDLAISILYKEHHHKLLFIMCSSSNVQVLSSKGHRGSESEKHPSVWTSGVCAVFCNRCRSPVWLMEVYVEHTCPVGKDTFLSDETVVAAVPTLLVGEIHFTFIWPRRLVVVIRHWRFEVGRPEKNSHMCNWNCHKPPKYNEVWTKAWYTQQWYNSIMVNMKKKVSLAELRRNHAIDVDSVTNLHSDRHSEPTRAEPWIGPFSE